MFTYRRLWRLTIIPIVSGLHHQIYPKEFVHSSMAWDGLQATIRELGKTTMEIYMRLYSNMAILKNGAKMNLIIMLPMREYPFGSVGIRL